MSCAHLHVAAGAYWVRYAQHANHGWRLVLCAAHLLCRAAGAFSTQPECMHAVDPAGGGGGSWAQMSVVGVDYVAVRVATAISVVVFVLLLRRFTGPKAEI